MENFLVYVHTTPNNKVYVGLTSRDPEIRFGNKGTHYSSMYFSNAINKYGWDNITHEYMKGCLTKEEACQLEIELIAFYKSNNNDFGYNISSGGEHGSFKHTEETKQKLKELSKGRYKGKDNPMYGISPQERMSEEQYEIWRKNISKANSGDKNGRAKKVICITTSEIFTTVKAAAEKYNRCSTSISNCCIGKSKTCGQLLDGTKLTWKYYEEGEC